jgi:hypothetical protein
LGEFQGCPGASKSACHTLVQYKKTERTPIQLQHYNNCCDNTQEDLESLLSTVDKSVHGAESGSLTKTEVRSALESFFAVGQQGGKTVSRFDELMQVLHHLPHMSAGKHVDWDGESNEEGRNREKITSTCQSFLIMLHAVASLSHGAPFCVDSLLFKLIALPL